MIESCGVRIYIQYFGLFPCFDGYVLPTLVNSFYKYYMSPLKQTRINYFASHEKIGGSHA